jgi:hypothetical protein
MLRSTLLVLFVSLSIGCSVANTDSAQGRGNIVKLNEMDGVYEFVSETKALTKPNESTSQRTSSEWVGLWQFQRNYYSRVLTKKSGRAFPCDTQKDDSFGYESSAGTYKSEGNRIYLSEEFTISPLDAGRSKSLEYSFDGDTLTLTETLHAYVENINEGTITTVLRRVGK